MDELRRSGRRGRGGVGFPTAVKSSGVCADPAPTKFVCSNAAVGEPGTFKDRYLLRMSPCQVIEGLSSPGRLSAPTGQESVMIQSILDAFPDDAEAHLRGGCPGSISIPHTGPVTVSVMLLPP